MDAPREEKEDVQRTGGEWRDPQKCDAAYSVLDKLTFITTVSYAQSQQKSKEQDVEHSPVLQAGYRSESGEKTVFFGPTR